MELVYCYISDFNSLKDTELNFGWKYRFSFDAINSQLTGKIDEDYIEDFFSKSISNISAIVGQNGSGKSTVIEFLINYIPSGNASANPEAIVIHYDEKLGKVIIYLGPSFFDKIDIQLGTLDFEKVTSLRNQYDYPEIIYFSNSFYDRVIESNLGGLLNVSLKNLLFNYDSNNFFITDQKANITEVYYNFRFKEYWRILRLVQSGLDFGIDFRLPQYLLLFINENKESYVWNKFSKEHKVVISQIAKYYDDLSIKYINTNDRYIISLEKTIVFDYIAHFQDLKILSNINLIDLPLKKRELLNRVLEDYSSNMEITNYFLDRTEKLLVDYSQNTSIVNAWLDISKIDEREFKEYAELLRKVMNWDSNFISIGFSYKSNSIDEFSSGQMAFLSMLGRFYSLSVGEQRFANLSINTHATVLIDEGELYLHPAWQKKLINLLINTLSKIFNNAKVQIILTSHSPFVLSDLPKSKVTFLMQSTAKNTDSEILEHKQTFASNIHTLLADTFFLDNGFIGDFAKRKIDTVIQDLNSYKSIDQPRKEEIRKIILSIGEPIIKRKLLEMYETKFNLDIEQRISAIEKKIEKL